MTTTPPSWHRFSTSLTVATAIRASPRGWFGAAGFRLSLLLASLSLLVDGYPLAAAAMLVPVLWLCRWQGPRPRGIRCDGSRCLLLLSGRWCAVDLLAPVHSPPWLLVLRWRRAGEGAGAVHWLYLWPDSVAAGQWRRLRKVLSLQGGVGRHQHGVAGLR